MRQPVAIVFFPESGGIPTAVREWQSRNPDWRILLDREITCPVCGIPVRAIADHALIDPPGIREEIERYRNDYLRAACSNHAWPPEEYWTTVERRAR